MPTRKDRERRAKDSLAAPTGGHDQAKSGRRRRSVCVHAVHADLCRLHSRVREKMGIPSDFVIHGLRHAMLTRLAEVGTDLSILKEIAGHAGSSVTERYVHPSSESKERAFDKLETAYPEIAAGVQELHMEASRRKKKSRK
jgi:integrase